MSSSILKCYTSRRFTLDEYLTSLIEKLSCITDLLSKVRHYVPKHLLRTIYYSIFNWYLIYACEEVLGKKQNNILFKKLNKVQNKALRLINFQLSNTPTGPLYHASKTLKIGDFINYKNTLFVRNTPKKSTTV